MRAILLLLLLSSLVYSSCSGDVNLRVPAVVGDGGNLVTVNMRLVPGSGQVFVGTSPKTGMDTQVSVEDAVSVVRNGIDNPARECDLLVTFGGKETGSYVEGPSAGAAMAVMAYALLNNQTLRSDTVVTGSIDLQGNVGPVGGLYEKAKAAASNGADYFITPQNSFYETLILRNVNEKYGITILQVGNLDDLIGFMAYNQTIDQAEFKASVPDLPDIEPYYESDVSDLEGISQDMLVLMANAVQNLRSDDPESTEVKKFFENQLNYHRLVAEKEYHFTAANGAFLDYIEIMTVSAILNDDMDTDAKKADIIACLESLEKPEMTDQNFQWIVGSELREIWALDKLNESTYIDPVLLEDKYILYHELMYADAWCHVSKTLEKRAPDSGKPLNESAWKDLADEMLARAEKFPHSEDSEKRLVIARKSYDMGNYGAAIFDAVFVYEMDAADLETEVLESEELSDKVDALVSETPTSLWGRTYHTQGVFIAKSGGSSDSAYHILMLGKGLDSATGMMMLELETKTEEPESPSGDLMLFFELLMLLIFLVVLYTSISSLRRGSDGNNNKRRSPANRAQQKNSRA